MSGLNVDKTESCFVFNLSRLHTYFFFFFLQPLNDYFNMLFTLVMCDCQGPSKKAKVQRCKKFYSFNKVENLITNAKNIS